MKHRIKSNLGLGMVLVFLNVTQEGKPQPGVLLPTPK